jgi:Tfp pilus assembly protein PilF/TolB-like protein
LLRLRIFAVSIVVLYSLVPFAGFGQQSIAPTRVPVDADRPANRIVLILPFHNDSKAPGLEWVGEAFPEVMRQQMQSSSIFVISREDRLYAFDRVGIPASAQLSRATLLRIAEQMDVDFVVLGSYNYDGSIFSAKTQLLDMRRLHLSHAVTESGSLLQLIDIQAATAWDLMHEMQPTSVATKQDFISETKDIRLDALENYVRGVIDVSTSDKIHHLKEALRLNPNYTVAVLQLGKTYFDQRDYASAIAWFSKIPSADKHATEANFFLGLSAYYSGDMARADQAFRLVAARLPLTEVYNNLGVVNARQGKSSAVEYLERAVQADPTDADYHFNLGIALAHSHDNVGAIRQLKEALDLRPSDGDAKAVLEGLSNSSSPAGRLPAERIKRNYDEASFRQLAFAVESAEEAQMAHTDPKKHAAMRVDLGKEKFRQGFYEEARDNFRKALALDPENRDAHVGLANAQIALNDLESARSELDSTLKTQPNSDAYVALGELDLRENKLDAASDDVAQALRMEPSNNAALQLKQQVTARLNATSQRNR